MTVKVVYDEGRIYVVDVDNETVHFPRCTKDDGHEHSWLPTEHYRLVCTKCGTVIKDPNRKVENK